MSKSFVWLALFIFCWSSCDSKSLKDHQFVRNVEPLSERYNLEKQNEFWLNNGRKYVEKQIRREPNQKIAKNVILFLGDGMSVPTLAALRVYLGGEEKKFSFEDFEGVGMSKTYCVDGQVADSACSATAYLTGVKGNRGTIGVNAKVQLGNCTAALDKSTQTQSIAKWAMDAGKWAGIVTTTSITDASPAGNYANIAQRRWQNDRAIRDSGCDPRLVTDIAQQLVNGEVGSKLKVILGGGRKQFRDYQTWDEGGANGEREDGKDLIEEWLLKGNYTHPRTYVHNTLGLQEVDTSQIDSLLGLFHSSNLPYRLDTVEKGSQDKEPSLEQMVAKAIDLLSKNKEGYFLFVEGGRIDHGHHATKAQYALDEAAEFSKAIAYARRAVSDHDTLIVVTADHAHTMSYSGYPARGNNIFGMAGVSEKDNLPYMTLSYANGLGSLLHQHPQGGRVNPTTLDYNHKSFTFPATVPLSSETHGGDDAAVYATGPWSHLFTGTFEQNVIPHLMAYAACIGDGLKACDSK